MTTSDWLLPAASAFVALGSAGLSYRQSTRAATVAGRNEAARVDGEAYDRAKDLYEAGIRQLEQQVERLRTQVNAERQISEGLRIRVGELEHTVRRLRHQLEAMGSRKRPPRGREGPETEEGPM